MRDVDGSVPAPATRVAPALPEGGMGTPVPRHLQDSDTAAAQRPFTSAAAVDRWVRRHGTALLLIKWLGGDFRGPALVAVRTWLRQRLGRLAGRAPR